MTLFITMNSADRALQLQGAEHYHDTGSFIISAWSPGDGRSFRLFAGDDRTWLLVAVYHRYLRLPQLPAPQQAPAYLTGLPERVCPVECHGQDGKNMENVQNEVKYMIQPELAQPRTGSQEIRRQRRIRPELGRTCWMPTAVPNADAAQQPARPNQTGKLLSLRKS